MDLEKVKELAKQRDAAFAAWEANPTAENSHRYRVLKAQVKELAAQYRIWLIEQDKGD